MFKAQSSLTDTRNNTQDTQDEETYQRLFKKIARDFIFKDDLDGFLDNFYEEMQRAQEENRQVSKDEMRYFAMGSIAKALEYKHNLSLPKHKRKKYKDVTDG